MIAVVNYLKADFGTFSAIEKPLAGHKKSFCRPHGAHGLYVVQACPRAVVFNQGFLGF